LVEILVFFFLKKKTYQPLTAELIANPMATKFKTIVIPINIFAGTYDKLHQKSSATINVKASCYGSVAPRPILFVAS
jgi:glucose-6-phosphate-specific signal transduction histidine kinase